MRALIVYAHPRSGSFNEAIRDIILQNLQGYGVETRLRDLYAEAFNPVMDKFQLENYDDHSQNKAGLEEYVEDLVWCDMLIFVYPTWWYGLPAILKGWIDRVFLPGIAFHMPSGHGKNISPGLKHITRLAIFTTCGASWWLTQFVGSPGKRTILRGVGLLCARHCKTVYLAHYLMDSSTEESRSAHLKKVARKLDSLVKR